MIRVLKARHPRGRCRYCHCTEKNACRIALRAEGRIPGLKASITCSWINEQETVCSAPTCVRKHRAHERTKAMRQKIRVRNGRQLFVRRSA